MWSSGSEHAVTLPSFGACYPHSPGNEDFVLSRSEWFATLSCIFLSGTQKPLLSHPSVMSRGTMVNSCCLFISQLMSWDESEGKRIQVHLSFLCAYQSLPGCCYKNIPVAAFMIRKWTKSFLWTTEKRKDNNIKKKKMLLLILSWFHCVIWKIGFISFQCTHTVCWLAGCFFCQHDTN